MSAARRTLLRVTRFFFMIGAKDNGKETAMWHFTRSTGKRARESHCATVLAKDNRS
ncbi:hypothetical protein [Paraburkholderia phenoliruptrix]|uniref:Uncharacterized protein n=1 Tax=Paraburkholderia phenoliruptrix TaxID=252970 RepID=A0ABV3WI22_9BURK|nr:hypothetical protein [Paraburkholderia phenoliruptrix]MDR6391991.1 hypothetical protein [Paraburkholderia phenoliruptrix]